MCPRFAQVGWLEPRWLFWWFSIVVTDAEGVGGFSLRRWPEIPVLPEMFQVVLTLAGGPPLWGNSPLGS